MALELRQNLSVRMEQKLKLTPQMIQSIEILLLPQMALEERIMAEIESNPVLEILEGEGGELAAEAPSTPDSEVGDRYDREVRNEDPEEWSELLKRRSSAASDEDAPDKMEAICPSCWPCNLSSVFAPIFLDSDHSPHVD